MRQDSLDEKDGGEQRAPNTMENAIYMSEKGETSFASYPDACRD